jgi:hypothetical protein
MDESFAAYPGIWNQNRNKKQEGYPRKRGISEIEGGLENRRDDTVYAGKESGE